MEYGVGSLLADAMIYKFQVTGDSNPKIRRMGGRISLKEIRWMTHGRFKEKEKGEDKTEKKKRKENYLCWWWYLFGDRFGNEEEKGGER